MEFFTSSQNFSSVATKSTVKLKVQICIWARFQFETHCNCDPDLDSAHFYHTKCCPNEKICIKRCMKPITWLPPMWLKLGPQLGKGPLQLRKLFRPWSRNNMASDQFLHCLHSFKSKYNLMAWCKTIVTPSHLWRSNNSFTPSYGIVFNKFRTTLTVIWSHSGKSGFIQFVMLQGFFSHLAAKLYHTLQGSCHHVTVKHTCMLPLHINYRQSHKEFYRGNNVWKQ